MTYALHIINGNFLLEELLNMTKRHTPFLGQVLWALEGHYSRTDKIQTSLSEWKLISLCHENEAPTYPFEAFAA